jgi:DNA-directed RNA polymerase specialized sigma24 family protein
MSPSRAAELAQHRDAVERYLLRLVMNRDDAEDLAQDTMAVCGCRVRV